MNTCSTQHKVCIVHCTVHVVPLCLLRGPSEKVRKHSCLASATPCTCCFVSNVLPRRSFISVFLLPSLYCGGSKQLMNISQVSNALWYVGTCGRAGDDCKVIHLRGTLDLHRSMMDHLWGWGDGWSKREGERKGGVLLVAVYHSQDNRILPSWQIHAHLISYLQPAQIRTSAQITWEHY